MGVEIDLSELRQLSSRVSSAGGRIGAAASAVLRRTALKIEADAKALAPVATIETSGYLGGNLRNSISTTFEGDGRHGSMSAEIGPTAEYGIYQEYGTSRMGAQPFMGPSYDRNVGGYTEALAQVMERAI